jgi:integrase/recombinase XerD
MRLTPSRFNTIRTIVYSMSELGRNPEDYLKEKVTAGTVTRDDAGLILRYLDEESNRAGLAEHTTLSNSRYISHAAERVPGIGSWDNQKINGYVRECRKKYKANTTRKHILLTKQFCEWLVRNKLNTTLDIAGIRAIKAPAADKMTKTAAMMLSTEEVEKIIAAGKNVRDRCLMSMLAESGMRPFELLGLKWQDLKIDQHGVVINVSGKTEIPRFIRLVHSSPYIAAWRNDHPDPTETAHIFVSLRAPDMDEQLTHSGLKKVVRLAVERAGVTKKVSPYLFRHSNVTRMLEEGYSDSTIRMVHWGSQTTAMLGTYGHVSSAAIDAELLDKAGVVTSEKKERKRVNQCYDCKTILKPGDQFCPKCGKPQSEEAQAQVQSDESRLFDQFKKFMAAQKQ